MNDERGRWTSASNAPADLLCPGRHQAQLDLPQAPRDKDADFGARIHAALAVSDASGLSLEECDIFDACQQIETKLVSQYFGLAELVLPIEKVAEKRFWQKHSTHELWHSGQVDALHLCGQKALILEYKSLAGEVAISPRNLQLRDLVCLVEANLTHLSQVACAVIQPLVTHQPELCEYGKDDILRAGNEMWERIKLSNTPGAYRDPGEVQCKFCRAKPNCQPYQQWAGGYLPVKASLLDVPMADWTGEQCAQFLAGEAVARKWLDNAGEMIKTRLKANPDSVPGYCLDNGQNRETITDLQQVFNRFVLEGGTLEQFMACLNGVKGRLKEQLHQVTKLTGKALDTKLKSLLEGLVEIKKTEPSIKRKDKT